jgi:hypothetical protein
LRYASAEPSARARSGSDMQDVWVSCRIYIKARGGKPRQAYVVLHGASNALEPRSYVVLLLRHPNGTVIQVPGKVARRRGRGSVEVYIPVDAALSLAVWMGVKVEKSTTVYGYAAKIKEVSPPAV